MEKCVKAMAGCTSMLIKCMVSTFLVPITPCDQDLRCGPGLARPTGMLSAQRARSLPVWEIIYSEANSCAGARTNETDAEQEHESRYSFTDAQYLATTIKAARPAVGVPGAPSCFTAQPEALIPSQCLTHLYYNQLLDHLDALRRRLQKVPERVLLIGLVHLPYTGQVERPRQRPAQAGNCPESLA